MGVCFMVVENWFLFYWFFYFFILFFYFDCRYRLHLRRDAFLGGMGVDALLAAFYHFLYFYYLIFIYNLEEIGSIGKK